jgi:hypothetical protein
MYPLAYREMKFKNFKITPIFFFFNRHYNPSCVSACSTVVEHSQQEGFPECRCQRHV